MISQELLSEVLGVECDNTRGDYQLLNGYLYFGTKGDGSHRVNIHELAFDKCIEWAWERGYTIRMFRANNIFHARVDGISVDDIRFYSNPHNKYDAVIQACEWIKERK